MACGSRVDTSPEVQVPWRHITGSLYEILSHVGRAFLRTLVSRDIWPYFVQKSSSINGRDNFSRHHNFQWEMLDNSCPPVLSKSNFVDSLRLLIMGWFVRMPRVLTICCRCQYVNIYFSNTCSLQCVFNPSCILNACLFCYPTFKYSGLVATRDLVPDRLSTFRRCGPLCHKGLGTR